MSAYQEAITTSRFLRRNQTKAECIFWQRVRDKQFHGLKFRRQHPLFYTFWEQKRFFIADFYCKGQQLVVEIDGGIHRQQKDYDRIRSEILHKQKHLRIIRYKNKNVLNNIEAVLKDLEEQLNIHP